MWAKGETRKTVVSIASSLDSMQNSSNMKNLKEVGVFGKGNYSDDVRELGISSFIKDP